jgi:uncharacterized RDD family membrane protein YckC
MPELTTPSLRRRLSSMLYESMLLFGVLFMSGWLFSTLLQQRHALYLRHALEGWLFLVLAMYFIWFWTHGGQTLAMKTWRFRVVDRDGQPVRLWRAALRFVLAWLWILPGLALAAGAWPSLAAGTDPRSQPAALGHDIAPGSGRPIPARPPGRYPPGRYRAGDQSRSKPQSKS